MKIIFLLVNKINKHTKMWAIVLGGLLLFGVSACKSNDSVKSHNLMETNLFSSKAINSPVNMAVFLPETDQLIEDNFLQGHIRLTPNAKQSFIAPINVKAKDIGPLQGLLPNIEFDFIQHKQTIIPLQRGLQLTQHPHWDYIVGLGKIWPQEEQKALFKIAMPFSLVEKNQNCVHNGALTFLIDYQGKTSNFYYQISSETCLYFNADFWGKGQVNYQAKVIPTAKTVIENFKDEIANRIKTKNIKELKNKYHDINVAKLSLKNIISREKMTLYGVVDQYHYVSDCQTRHGLYPFCDELVLPSYSTAKSLFAGLAMLRLAKIYPNIYHEKVTDWVPACDQQSWQEVTLGHLLNMTSGHYLSNKDTGDEDAKHSLIFFNAKTHQEKIRYSCRYLPKKQPAGERFIYHTSDTYLLGTALTHFIKAKKGKHADIFNDVLVNDLWPVIGFSPVVYSTRRTIDELQQPFSGYGLFLLRDDIAKLSRFFNQQLLMYSTAQESLLEVKNLKEALQRLDHPSGVKTSYDFLRYSNGFWARKVSDFLGCKKETWLPFMSGYGGISIVLLPDGREFYYVSDSGKFSWRSAIKELHKIKAICD